MNEEAKDKNSSKTHQKFAEKAGKLNSQISRMLKDI
jgi:hypothetical protein